MTDPVRRDAGLEQPAAGRPRYLEERTYFPAGMDPDDTMAVHYAVRVVWRQGEKWAVVQGLGFPAHRFLSQTGRWLLTPAARHRRYCRFDFETACRLAEEHVDAVEVGGLTWAAHQEWWRARQDAERAAERAAASSTDLEF